MREDYRVLIRPFTLVLIFSVLWFPSIPSETIVLSPSPDWHIQGISASYGWSINVTIDASSYTTGTFEVEGNIWDNVQYIHKGSGMGSYSNMIWILGRKNNNYILLFIYVNVTGSSFIIWYFNYKGSAGDDYSTLLVDSFSGSYDITGSIAPNLAAWDS